MRHFTTRQICAALNCRGWSLVRQTGSHAQYKHPDFDKLITIPMHGNKVLPSGLQKHILKTANLEESDID